MRQNLTVFRALSRSEAELKDRWTKGHSERVAGYAEQLTRKTDLGDRETAELRLAALLHDIGKIGLRVSSDPLFGGALCRERV